MKLSEFLKSIGKTVLEMIVYKTVEEALEAVKRNGCALQYVKDQTEAVCLEAVKEDGDALQYVKDQTEAVCLEAVKRNGCALQYVKDQTEAVCLEAVKEDGDALQYVNPFVFEVDISLTVEPEPENTVDLSEVPTAQLKKELEKRAE